jgi:L-threonylcarbamoyladenylate synthase
MASSMKSLIVTQVLEKTEVAKAVELLRSGEIIAFPTETVYGLGAPIFSLDSIKKIFEAKGRPSDNPLIAHVSTMAHIERIAKDIPDEFYLLYQHFFPGPLTVVLPKRESVPSIVSAGLPTIALRMPSHPVAKALIDLLDEPIVAPSANLSGRPSATHFSHVLHDFDGKIAAVITSYGVDVGIESTVISLAGERPIILRPGAILRSQIEDVLGATVDCVSSASLYAGPVMSPGMKYRHYAPDAVVQVFTDHAELLSSLKSFEDENILLLSRQLNDAYGSLEQRILCSQNLYASLRDADLNGFSYVFIYCDDITQQNEGLMNRILKASSKV